jgi:arylsulfatase A-like enzyme
MVGGAPALLGQRARRPNVVVVVADEWRAQSTGYGGDRNVRTPTLDRMAAESISFETAVSSCPVCCPYRASLMTGQYPLTNGVFINDVELTPNGPTLGETFQKAGYATGFIGKWHLYGSPDGKYGRRLAYIPPEKHLGFDYWKACECTHEYNHSLYYDGNDPTPKYWPGYDAFAQTDDACGFIEHQAGPFLLMLSLGPPHFPYATAPERYQEMYRDKNIQLRPNIPADKRREATESLRGYYAHMTAVDDCMDRILRTLEKAGVARGHDCRLHVRPRRHDVFSGADDEALPLGRIDTDSSTGALSAEVWAQGAARPYPSQCARLDANAARVVRTLDSRFGGGD